VERVVLNALAKETRLCRLISAPSANNLHIVFGEADPPFPWRHGPQRFSKIFFTSEVSAWEKLRLLNPEPRSP
jgi:hypothetical protein